MGKTNAKNHVLFNTVLKKTGTLMKDILKAVEFATRAHDGQVRKYTNEPYIVHPIAVARIVSTVTNDIEMIQSAILHDTVEDTFTEINDIEMVFGMRVACLVEDLTDISCPEDGNRAVRKQLDLDHTASIHPDSKTIKLADLLDNTESITKYDPNFAKIYMKEKEKLLEVLTEGNSILLEQAQRVLTDYYLGRLQWK